MSDLTDFRFPGDSAASAVLNHLDSPVVNAFSVALSSYEFLFLTLLLTLAFLAVRFRKRALRGIVAVALAIAFTDAFGARILKPFFARARPCFADPEAIRMLAPISNVGSLPSLHSANAFAFATAVTFLFPRLGFALFPLAVSVALSRVVLGHHWLSDVIAGSLYGCAVGVAFMLLERRVLKRVHAQATPTGDLSREA